MAKKMEIRHGIQIWCMKRESGKVISPNSRLIMFQTSFYQKINLKALFPDPEASDPMQ